MKTNQIISILSILFLSLFINLNAQDVDKKISEAQTAYKSGKYDDARFALQQALNDLDIILGKEVLTILPVKMKNLSSVAKDDQVTAGSGGFTGLTVTRKYKQATDSVRSAEILIMSDSPLLTSINTILSIPVFGAGDPNQKRVKIDGYKGLLQKNQSETRILYDLQIPFGNSLLTFKTSGFNESEVMEMANTISVSKIVEITK